MRWLVTGGLGFIGSHFIRMVMHERPAIEIVNLDAMTYAGNPENLRDIETLPRYRFVHGNICDRATVEAMFETPFDAIINFAAETHVDRSIVDPEAFLKTDIFGTHVLLETARKYATPKYVQVSTDEVYGEVLEGASHEEMPVRPRSPYSASKAAGDLQVLAYYETYKLPVLITRGSNTYGPYQYPEKLIPLFVTNLLDDLPVPVYGDGLHVRDWLHVEDHARGVLHVLEHGTPGHTYNIGGGNSQRNIDITLRLIDACNRSKETHLTHVTDRAGHDRRYALDCKKLHALGWQPRIDFDGGLEETVNWYREHEAWWRPLKEHAAYMVFGR